MNKEKVIQLMKIFAEKSGGSISDVKMMKLLYFTDRLSLVNTGHPISYDDYFSLNRGPILSSAKNMIDQYNDLDFIEIFTAPVNCQSPNEYPLKRFSLKSIEKDFDALSEQEVSFADAVFQEMGGFNDDEIVSHSHRPDICPEWKWPNGSSIPINIEAIFLNIGLSTSEIAQQVAEIQYHKKIQL